MRLPPDRDREASERARRRGADVAYGQGSGARGPEGLVRARPAGVATVGRTVPQVAFPPSPARVAGRLKSQRVALIARNMKCAFRCSLPSVPAQKSLPSRLQPLVRPDSILATPATPRAPRT